MAWECRMHLWRSYFPSLDDELEMYSALMKVLTERTGGLQ